ncbi:MAG: ribonuclease HII [Candidatus Paracaedibacteraceae bacterium]|nr:ribonuclease HII [Candidatus Paracaedibacteraceae bacterium]
MEKSPTLFYENQHKGVIAGLDEAGCGPWAGPLVAAAVVLPKVLPSIMLKVNDSKKLNAAKRAIIYEELVSDATVLWGVGVVSVDELDRILLRKALPLAFERAVAALSLQPAVLLIDGIRDPKLPFLTQLIKSGDQLSLSIAAASIIAKVTRDRMMEALHVEYPEYGWAANAGYGTVQHRKALQIHGVTKQHRRSYAPIKALLANSQKY